MDICVRNRRRASTPAFSSSHSTKRMTSRTADPQALYESVIFELTKAFALPQTDRAHLLVDFFLGKAARAGALAGSELDNVIARGGTNAGANWFIARFVRTHEARGVENIPATGPFVVAANHPGALDAMTITAHIPRKDFKVIIGDIRFFKNLPHVCEHAIFAPQKADTVGRMSVIRESIRHLQHGGGLLIFPRGGIEPDPACMPDPEGEFHLWSRSLEIFLQRVPDLKILITIVGGVLSPAALKHPMTWLRKKRPDRQRIAFIYQLARQLLSGKQLFDLVPRVTFGEVIEADHHEHTLAEIEHAARRTLAKHMAWSKS